MTRRHIDDLAGRLIKAQEYGGEKREQLIIPALNDRDESIRENRYSTSYLNGTKDNIGVRDFAALYMQDPVASTGSIFKPDKRKYFLESDFEKADGILKKDDIQFGIFVDPAFSTSTKSDDAVVMAVGRHKITGDIYRYEIYANTSAPSDTIRAIFNLADKRTIKGYNIEFVSIEKASINKDQTKFTDDFKQEMQKRNKYYTVYEYESHQKKEDRIKFNLEKMFDNGKIYFMRGPDVNESKRMEEQLTLFPNSKKDDIIDCLSQACEVFDKRSNVMQGVGWIQRHRANVGFNKLTGQPLNGRPNGVMGSTQEIGTINMGGMFGGN